jgi:hypothetical protein
MSLINDALKQARQAPPRSTPNVLPPRPDASQEPGTVAIWLPVIVILLIIAGIFFLGWTMAHRTVREIVTAPEPVSQPDMVEAAPPTETVKPVATAPPATTTRPDAPVLQGIFYLPKNPSAIVDGKTVRPGDMVGQYYRVKEITQYTVTLIGQDNKPFKIGLDH